VGRNRHVVHLYRRMLSWDRFGNATKVINRSRHDNQARQRAKQPLKRLMPSHKVFPNTESNSKLCVHFAKSSLFSEG
jgi:hypothetical protein